MNRRIIYPVIVEKFEDAGVYYTIESPDINGMITEGTTIEEAVYWAEDAIAVMLDGEKEYPKPSDPTKWTLTDNQLVVYVSVDMDLWYKQHSKTIRKTISVPEYIVDRMKEKGLNASKIATEAFELAIEA